MGEDNKEEPRDRSEYTPEEVQRLTDLLGMSMSKEEILSRRRVKKNG